MTGSRDITLFDVYSYAKYHAYSRIASIVSLNYYKFINQEVTFISKVYKDIFL